MNDPLYEQRKTAFRILQAHNLWRRGKIDINLFSPGEIGNAIDTAMGALMDVCAMSRELDIQEKIAAAAKAHQQKTYKENQRLKALLATHKIKYKKGDN